MKFILFLCFGILISCGKNKIEVNLKPKEILPFYLSNQESLVSDYPVIKKVDLREVVFDLEELPIEYDSFEKIYRSLLSYSKKYRFNRAVLVSGDNCDVPITYCFAYLIYKPKSHH